MTGRNTVYLNQPIEVLKWLAVASIKSNEVSMGQVYQKQTVCQVSSLGKSWRKQSHSTFRAKAHRQELVVEQLIIANKTQNLPGLLSFPRFTLLKTVCLKTDYRTVSQVNFSHVQHTFKGCMVWL